MKINENQKNYINVAYKGAHYICIEGSHRARLMREANQAWLMGYDWLASELETKAIDAPGCAMRHALESYNG